MKLLTFTGVLYVLLIFHRIAANQEEDALDPTLNLDTATPSWRPFYWTTIKPFKTPPGSENRQYVEEYNDLELEIELILDDFRLNYTKFIDDTENTIKEMRDDAWERLDNSQCKVDSELQLDAVRDAALESLDTCLSFTHSLYSKSSLDKKVYNQYQQLKGIINGNGYFPHEDNAFRRAFQGELQKTGDKLEFVRQEVRKFRYFTWYLNHMRYKQVIANCYDHDGLVFMFNTVIMGCENAKFLGHYS